MKKRKFSWYYQNRMCVRCRSRNYWRRVSQLRFALSNRDDGEFDVKITFMPEYWWFVKITANEGD